MNKLILSIFILLLVFQNGCSSSIEMQQSNKVPISKKELPPSQPTVYEIKVDTLEVDLENYPKTVPEPIDLPPPPPDSKLEYNGENFSIQIGAFNQKENAIQLTYTAKQQLKINVYNIYDEKLNIYRVLVGNFSSKDSAHSYHKQLIDNFPEYQDSWIVDLKKELGK